MEFINLTPHTINLITESGKKVIPASGVIARVEQTTTLVREIDGIPVVQSHWGDILDLPDPKEDTLYIVSAMVANAAKAKGRIQDVVCPGDFVRNDAGQIQGARNLMYV